MKVAFFVNFMLTPREILGNKIIEDIRDALYKLGTKPEYVFEIVLDVEKSVPTVDKVCKENFSH